MISVGGVGGASETANQRGENPAATLLPTTCVMSQICTQTNQREDVYIYAFSRCFNPKWLTAHSGYTFIISICVPWESNPQPFALLTQCSNHWATGTLKTSFITIRTNEKLSLLTNVFCISACFMLQVIWIAYCVCYSILYDTIIWVLLINDYTFE